MVTGRQTSVFPIRGVNPSKSLSGTKLKKRLPLLTIGELTPLPVYAMSVMMLSELLAPVRMAVYRVSLLSPS